MSSPRHDWWGYVKNTLYRYPNCQRQAERRAIAKTVQTVEASAPDAAQRMELIRLMYWGKTRYTLTGAAQKLPGISEATAKRWHREFIYTVAHNMGLTKCK